MTPTTDQGQAPISMRLPCPSCGTLHIDEGEFETKVHHTHACQHCGMVWRPAVVATVGVRFLSGYKNQSLELPAVSPQPAEAVGGGTSLPPFLANEEDAVGTTYDKPPVHLGSEKPTPSTGPGDVVTGSVLKDAWKALDNLVGKLPMHEFRALEKCVVEAQDAAEAAERIWINVKAATIDKPAIAELPGKWEQEATKADSLPKELAFSDSFARANALNQCAAELRAALASVKMPSEEEIEIASKDSGMWFPDVYSRGFHAGVRWLAAKVMGGGE